MQSIYDTFRPDGFSTVNAYLFDNNPQKLIDFLKNAFGAEEKSRTLRPGSEEIANCILKIGSSCFMISQASGPFLNMRTAFYFFTEEVDELYKRALQHGAKSVFEPADTEYGDRQGGVEDVSGNYWWISKRLVKGDYS